MQFFDERLQIGQSFRPRIRETRAVNQSRTDSRRRDLPDNRRHHARPQRDDGQIRSLGEIRQLRKARIAQHVVVLGIDHPDLAWKAVVAQTLHHAAQRGARRACADEDDRSRAEKSSDFWGLAEWKTFVVHGPAALNRGSSRSDSQLPNALASMIVTIIASAGVSAIQGANCR